MNYIPINFAKLALRVALATSLSVGAFEIHARVDDPYGDYPVERLTEKDLRYYSRLMNRIYFVGDFRTIYGLEVGLREMDRYLRNPGRYPEETGGTGAIEYSIKDKLAILRGETMGEGVDFLGLLSAFDFQGISPFTLAKELRDSESGGLDLRAHPSSRLKTYSDADLGTIVARALILRKDEPVFASFVDEVTSGGGGFNFVYGDDHTRDPLAKINDRFIEVEDLVRSERGAKNPIGESSGDTPDRDWGDTRPVEDTNEDDSFDAVWSRSIESFDWSSLEALERAEQQQALNDLRGYWNILAFAAWMGGDRDAAQAISMVGGGFYEIGSAVAQYEANVISGLALTGTVAGVALAITIAAQDSGPDANQLILDALARLGRQLIEMEQRNVARFGQIQASMRLYYRRLARQLADLRGGLGDTQAMLSDLYDRLSDHDATLRTFAKLDYDQFRRLEELSFRSQAGCDTFELQDRPIDEKRQKFLECSLQFADLAINGPRATRLPGGTREADFFDALSVVGADDHVGLIADYVNRFVGRGSFPRRGELYNVEAFYRHVDAYIQLQLAYPEWASSNADLTRRIADRYESTTQDYLRRLTPTLLSAISANYATSVSRFWTEVEAMLASSPLLAFRALEAEKDPNEELYLREYSLEAGILRIEDPALIPIRDHLHIQNVPWIALSSNRIAPCRAQADLSDAAKDITALKHPTHGKIYRQTAPNIADFPEFGEVGKVLSPLSNPLIAQADRFGLGEVRSCYSGVRFARGHYRFRDKRNQATVNYKYGDKRN